MVRPWFGLTLLLVACSGEPNTDKPAENPTPSQGEPAAPAVPDKSLALGDLTANASMDTLVPSPAETQRAMSNAGLASSLVKLTEGRDFKVDVADNDEVAVRTGVVLAHVVLGARETPKERLVAQLATLKTGLTKLGAGDKIVGTLDDLSARIANDATGRDELVRELDELANVTVPEVEFNIGDRALPLLRAGAWLEGAWLVTGAIQAEGKYDAADALLKQPAVVAYFKDYLYGPGKEVAPVAINTELQATLNTLEGITAKETLSKEDVDAIHTATDGLLSKIKD